MNRTVCLMLLCAVLSIVTGCGPDRKTIVESQVKTKVLEEFNEKNFPAGGILEDKDQWGNNLTWSLTKNTYSDELIVRSNGPDGLPLTRDDIVGKRTIERPDQTRVAREELRKKRDQALSQVNVLVNKEFDEKNFPDGGVFPDKDVWGGEVTWVLKKGYFSYGLTVRSNGPDGLPFTSDDIVARKSIPFPDGQGAAERYIRGVARGWIRGLREGAKNDIPPETKK